MDTTLENLDVGHENLTSEFVENAITNQIINQSSESPVKMALCDQITRTSDLDQDLKAGVVDFIEIPVEMNLTSTEQQYMTDSESTLNENNHTLDISKVDLKSMLDISNIDYTSTQSETLDSSQGTLETIVIKMSTSDTEIDDVEETFDSVDKNYEFENSSSEDVDSDKSAEYVVRNISVPVDRKMTRSFLQSVVPNTSDGEYQDGDSDSDKDEHEEEKEFKCLYCDKAFSEKRSVIFHTNSHHVILECAECGLKVGSYKELIEHSKEHESTLFSCKRCEKAFSHAIDFLKHSSRHRKDKKITCEICSQVYENGKPYRAHISTHKKIKCKICSKAFINQTLLNVHMKYHNKKIKCPECGKEYAHQKDLSYHMVSHTGLKVHQCLYCGKGFANSGQRDNHTKRRHLGEKSIYCSVCHKRQKNAEALAEHLKTHTEIKVKNVKCELCDQKFYTNLRMKVHLRNHTKKLSCHLCEYTTACTTSLKSHIIHNHTTEKLFKCDLCSNVSFKMHGDLLRHFKTIKHRVLEKNLNTAT